MKKEATKIVVDNKLKEKILPYDDDLPGGGQFYCAETGRYFQDQKALDAHKKTKFYKKRLKILRTEKQYTQDEANFGAGVTKEKLPPAHKPKRRN